MKAPTATERRQQRRRSILLMGVFTFLFHSIVPYYAVASTDAVDGYTTTICTAYGYKTVFVAFDETPSPPEANPSSYYECPTCIVHANASGWIDSYTALFEVLLPQTEGVWDGRHSLTPESRHYPPFLIRGPPA